MPAWPNWLWWYVHCQHHGDSDWGHGHRRQVPLSPCFVCSWWKDIRLSKQVVQLSRNAYWDGTAKNHQHLICGKRFEDAITVTMAGGSQCPSLACCAHAANVDLTPRKTSLISKSAYLAWQTAQTFREIRALVAFTMSVACQLSWNTFWRKWFPSLRIASPVPVKLGGWELRS